MSLSRFPTRPAVHGRPWVDTVVGHSAAFQQVVATIALVAPTNSTVLVHGETGTGKEVAARAIHQHSPRRQQPFVAFNAAAIPDSLAETELFGHVRGAFTDAVRDRAGRFEQAHHGTFFIDEVSSMSLPMQAKLLRVLQERQVERIGDSRSFSFDVRVIVATNVDLRKAVTAGTFREDLYYRLSVIPIALPALRERLDDIPVLAEHFVEKSCARNQVEFRTIADDAMRTLMAYSWPGNIRELENAIEHAVVMSGRSPQISVALLPEAVRQVETRAQPFRVSIPDQGIDFDSVVSQLERDLIRAGLDKTGGNKRQAARLLHLSRTTLIHKLGRLDRAEKRPA